MILQSGKRIELKLQPGDCKVPVDSEGNGFDENYESTVLSTPKLTRETKVEPKVESKVESKLETSTAIFTTSTEISVRTEINGVSALLKEEASTISDSWTPIIPNQVTEKQTMVESAAVLKPKRETLKDVDDDGNLIRQSNKRSFEIPALAKTTSTVQEDKQNVTDEKPVMVQLFPYRIASMFEKAERYARQTILPYLTEQFPTFFKKTIDLYDDNDTNIIEDSRFIVDTFDTVKPEKRAFRAQPANSSRRSPKGKDYIGQYRNLSGVQSVFAADKTNQSDVSKIDLPTYRPTKTTMSTRKPKYIPLERG